MATTINELILIPVGSNSFALTVCWQSIHTITHTIHTHILTIHTHTHHSHHLQPGLAVSTQHGPPGSPTPLSTHWSSCPQSTSPLVLHTGLTRPQASGPQSCICCWSLSKRNDIFRAQVPRPAYCNIIPYIPPPLQRLTEPLIQVLIDYSINFFFNAILS